MFCSLKYYAFTKQNNAIFVMRHFISELLFTATNLLLFQKKNIHQSH
jgi:hypothetical protein